MADITTIKKKIKQYCEKETQIQLAFLFGSVASGRQQPNSDVDLAFLCSRTSIPSGVEQLNMANKLSGLLKSNTDVVILNTAGTIINMQVLRKGIKLFERNRKVYSRFFIKTVNEYHDLKLVRSNIETNILNASIYDL